MRGTDRSDAGSFYHARLRKDAGVACGPRRLAEATDVIPGGQKSGELRFQGLVNSTSYIGPIVGAGQSSGYSAVESGIYSSDD